MITYPITLILFLTIQFFLKFSYLLILICNAIILLAFLGMTYFGGHIGFGIFGYSPGWAVFLPIFLSGHVLFTLYSVSIACLFRWFQTRKPHPFPILKTTIIVTLLSLSTIAFTLIKKQKESNYCLEQAMNAEYFLSEIDSFSSNNPEIKLSNNEISKRRIAPDINLGGLNSSIMDWGKSMYWAYQKDHLVSVLIISHHANNCKNAYLSAGSKKGWHSSESSDLETVDYIIKANSPNSDIHARIKRGTRVKIVFTKHFSPSTP